MNILMIWVHKERVLAGNGESNKQRNRVLIHMHGNLVGICTIAGINLLHDLGKKILHDCSNMHPLT